MDVMNNNNSRVKRNSKNDKNDSNFRSLIVENDKYKILETANKKECFM
jgi:hypothetical protein